MTTKTDPRIAVLSGMSRPSWHPSLEASGMPWDDAVKLLDAYRAAVLRDFLFRLEQSAGDAAAEKLLDDNPELAELLRAGTEASDG